MPNTGNERKHLGHKLGEAMAIKGVAQKDVAEEFSVSKPTVSSDWLKHGRIAKKHYVKLVEFFELPYEWWFGSPRRDSLREEIIKCYASLSPESRRALKKMATELCAAEHKDSGIKKIADEITEKKINRCVVISFADWRTRKVRDNLGGDNYP